jgi:hypothetical protein
MIGVAHPDSGGPSFPSFGKGGVVDFSRTSNNLNQLRYAHFTTKC